MPGRALNDRRDRTRAAVPAAVVVGEPTEMVVVSGHKGIATWNVTVTGHEAHSSLIHLGASANMVAVRLMHQLADLADRLAGRGSARALLPPSCHADHRADERRHGDQYPGAGMPIRLRPAYPAGAGARGDPGAVLRRVRGGGRRTARSLPEAGVGWSAARARRPSRPRRTAWRSGWRGAGRVITARRGQYPMPRRQGSFRGGILDRHLWSRLDCAGPSAGRIYRGSTDGAGAAFMLRLADDLIR